MSHRAKPPAAAVAFGTALVLLLGPRAALAADIPCAPVSQGGIQVDGLLGDWHGVTPLLVGGEGLESGRDEWSGEQDLSFAVFCNYDRSSLYLALRVTDEYFVRTPQAVGDDHVVLRFAGGRQLVIFPGNLRGIPMRVRWGRQGKPRGFVIAEAMQTDGYSVELSLPLAQVPGYRSGVPSLPLTVIVADSDSRARRRIQSRMSTGRSRVVFAQEQADLAAFLRDKGYRPSQVRWRSTIDVVGDSRVEQVVLVGRTLGIIGHDLPGGGYFYFDLPLRSPSDVTSVRALDLNGDRKAELVIQYVERSSSGFRELLAVFRFDSSNRFVRPFAHEVRKGQGSQLIVNRVSFRKRPRRRRDAGGVDVIVDKPTARGYTQESFREQPAGDCYPILLPWGETQRRTFRFDGDEYSVL